MLDITTTHPLSRWVVGRLKFHFDGGATAEHKVHLDEARRVRKVIDGKEESDALRWHSLRWLQWDGTRLVFSSFEVAEDAGWILGPEERTALEKADHPHGILRSLVELWAGENEAEPTYSALALHELHRAAVSGMSRKKWDQLARLAEGDKGNERLIDALLAETDRSSTASMNVDDTTEPESAPDVEPEGASTVPEPQTDASSASDPEGASGDNQPDLDEE